MLPRPPYTCWQCVHRARAVPRAGVAAIRYAASLSSTPSSTSPSPGTSTAPHGLPPLRRGSRIRDQLRQWELQNPTVRFDQISPDISTHAAVSNMKNRAEVPENSELRRFAADSGGWTADRDDELGDNLVSGHLAEPGDLVEVRLPNSRLPVLAIYLGFRGGNYHFYISTGKWRFTPTYTSYFTLSGFASRSVVDKIMQSIPADGSTETYIEMERVRQGPPRQAAGTVLDRLNEFQQRAQAVYQENISVLDNAFDEVALPNKFRYVSLFEIANRLLPSPDGELAPTALYAVHLALMNVDGGFRPVSGDQAGHKRDYLFEVSPWSHRQIIEKVELMTREYIRDMTARIEKEDGVLKIKEEELPGAKVLEEFLKKARAYVARSRQMREPTKFGIMGPYTKEKPIRTKTPEWTDEEKDILQFIEMWAAHRAFSRGSSINSIASSILRFTECYSDILDLTPTIGWLFLQETGWIPPWELPSRFRHRLPETSLVGGGSITRTEPPGVEKSLRPDIAAGRRRDWGDAPIFCIDSKSTTLIDDGISVEGAADGNYWLHVHVADPTSGILPKSQLARYLEAMPENVWVPGFLEEMLPPAPQKGDVPLAEKYSITKGSPSLTFSGLISPDGEILESRIEPGTLQNVIYLETEDVFGFTGQKEHPAPGGTLAVGTPPPSEPTKRTLTRTADLSSEHAEDLRTISRLANALNRRRDQQGALSVYPPQPTVKVSMHATGRDASGIWTGDPYIELGWGTRDDLRAVSSPMQMAGEIAARWCHGRGIAIPYRRETDSSSPAARATAQNLIRTVFTPQLERGMHLTPTQTRELTAALGIVIDSVEPAPFVKSGIDMYTRTTSPLRRFSDMLVHWQIHAALALEARLGRPITKTDVAKNTAPMGQSPSLTPLVMSSGGAAVVPKEIAADGSLIPYSKKELVTLISLVTMRSRLVRRIQLASDEWILHALVRAWRYPQDSSPSSTTVKGSLPGKFRFTTSDVGKLSIVGRVRDFYDRQAVMSLEGLDGVARLAEIKAGDEFEVVLDGVDVCERTIWVKALKRVVNEG